MTKSLRWSLGLICVLALAIGGACNNKSDVKPPKETSDAKTGDSKTDTKSDKSDSKSSQITPAEKTDTSKTELAKVETSEKPSTAKTSETQVAKVRPSEAVAVEAKKPNTGLSLKDVKLTGQGATFPAPLYQKWFKTFSQKYPQVTIDYQGTGSGAGVTAVIKHTVDFAGSDAAMSQQEMDQVKEGVQLLPMTAGAIVIAYNVKGVDELKLSRDAYTKIFLGKITKWNDPEIAKANPGVDLPDQKINVVVRSDSSGTSFVFTKHLSAVSEDFRKSPGVSKQPNWAVGTKANGNPAVANEINTTAGSIGYTEYGFAVKSKLKIAKLENKAGKYEAPDLKACQAALASIKMPDDLIAWEPDPKAEDAYPIVTYTWVILYQTYKDADKLHALKAVLSWALDEGQSISEEQGYVPLPKAVVEKVKAGLENVVVDKGA